MATSYKIHRHINAPLELQGLKGKYIFYAGALVLGSLFIFALMHIAGLNSWVSLALILAEATTGLTWIYRRSNRYGIHGWIKHRNARQMPKTLRCNTRTLFF